jgi:hypothetical protein
VRRRDPGPPLWTDAPPTANHHPLLKEQLVNPRIRWSQAPTSWDAPGWAPLVDHGPLPLQTARSVGRWLWPTLSVSGFLLVTGFVFGHDDPATGLSVRGLLTIALAAAVMVLLTLRRTAGPGPLARALFEYAVVFLLAVLVATTGVDVDQAPAGGKRASAVPDQRPALVRTIDGFRDWLSQWRDWARKETDRRPQSSPATLPAPNGQAMAASPAAPTSTRRPQ